MADDRYPRAPRPGEGLRREGPSADRKGDPLAELARLIGSTDPFADAPRPKPAPPAPRIADPSSWPDEEATPVRSPREEQMRATMRDEPPREPRFRPDDDGYAQGYAQGVAQGYAQESARAAVRDYADDYAAPRADIRHVPGFDDDDGEPEALDTWRPNDPYFNTEGMFPREPQMLADPVPRAEPQALRAEPQAPRQAVPPPPRGGASRDTSFDMRAEPRGWTPPRPSTAAKPAFDPDDPLGFERDAQASPQYARAPAPGQFGEPAAASPYRTAPRPAAGYGDTGEHDDLPPGFQEQYQGIPDHLPEAPHWPAGTGAGADPRTLHPDAYLRQRSQGAAPDPAAHFGDRPGGARDQHDDDERYSTEDLAAHYAQHAARPAPAAKRPRAAVIAAAVFGLCLVGAAGAFGYRMVFSGPSKPAPVIRADGAPNKVVPAAVDSGKQIQDRLADKGAGEKIVPREEQPVEIRDASRPPTPRMVFPNQTAGAASPVPTTTVQTPPPPAPFASSAAPVTGGQEPRRIRTVTIRSDQAQGGSGQGAPAPAARAPAAPPAATPAARADPNGPLSLSPAPAAPARTAGAAPAAPSLAAASSGGGYVVQVSAQKTEVEAETTFRSLQNRYPNQLGGRQPLIRRKETSSGTMYGAQVGPFAAREDAVQLCEGLKSAGGSCFVLRN